MSLSLHTIQIAMVLLIAAFHWAAASTALDHIAAGRLRQGARYLAIGVILLLDLPLLHLFVFYKDFHPELLDRLLHAWVAPFLALHAAAAISGVLLLLGRVAGVLRRRRTPVVDVMPEADATRTVVPAEPEEILPQLALPAGPTAPSRLEPVRSGLIIPSRRKFIYTAGMAAAGCVAGAGTLSAMETTDQHRLERVVLKVPNLPEGLKGTTIAMITDVHSSVFMTRQEMDRYVAALNSLKADMAVVVGDFVNSKLHEVYPFAESFSALKAPLGVYGVTGNHDYYTGAIETVAREVEQSGIRLLRNENLAIERNGAKLWLLGMDDDDIYDVKPYLETGKSARGTIENLLGGIPDGAPKLFLCHKPYPFEEYSQLGIDLMLSGHTHGGQVVIAQLDNVNLSFASLASSYVSGLYKSRSNRRSQMYVSRGVGTVGIPLRVNCPPEITQVILV